MFGDEDDRRRFLEELPLRAAARPRRAGPSPKPKAAAWHHSLEEHDVQKIIQDLPADAAARRRRAPARPEANPREEFQAKLAAFRRQLSSLRRRESPVERRRERLALMMEEAAGMLYDVRQGRLAEPAQAWMLSDHSPDAAAIGSTPARMSSLAALGPKRGSMVASEGARSSMTLPAGGALLFWTTCLSEGLRRAWKARPPGGGDASAGGLSELAFQEIFSTQLAHVNPPEVGRHRTVSFVAYYPEVFRDLRSHGWGVTDDEFLHSICAGPLSRGQQEGEEAERLVFTSWDKKYLAKTVMPSEVHFFADHLLAYHGHMRGSPSSLLPRFCGLYSLQFPKEPAPAYLVVLQNLFAPGVRMKESYEVKGLLASHRYVSKEEREKGAKVLKDRPCSSGAGFAWARWAFVPPTAAAGCILWRHVGE
ncbi:PIP5K1B [Symbiodinium natans]|uniref:PIP5K1B protein n=1 Tax=Symbiodinium natans TaxID=878477 RepID=A0A812LQU8_9DINO|nr:PIP5K1B [Symbiodinium natans]